MSKKLTVSDAEKITLELPNKKTVYFYIAPDPSSTTGGYLSFTQNKFWWNLPHFNLECEDKDEAYHAGIMAYRLHFEG